MAGPAAPPPAAAAPAASTHLSLGEVHALATRCLVANGCDAANAGAVATLAFALVATVVVWIIAAMTGAL